MADYNKLFCLYYLWCSKTYFRFVTIVFKFFPIVSCCHMALQKLNNIIFDRLTIENQLHIIGNLWRFDTIIDWKMLEEDFDK